MTAPGPGDAPLIKSFRWDLYTPTARAQANGTATEHATKPNEPRMTSNFLAYDENYKDGVALSTGWVAGGEGGAKSIITSQLGGAGTVRVWSTGSKLDGQPRMYLESPNHHEENIEYAEIASFAPFAGATPARPSRRPARVYGADLLVAGTTPAARRSASTPSSAPAPDATTLVPKLIATLPKMPAGPTPLGGR